MIFQGDVPNTVIITSTYKSFTIYYVFNNDPNTYHTLDSFNFQTPKSGSCTIGDVYNCQHDIKINSTEKAQALAFAEKSADEHIRLFEPDSINSPRYYIIQIGSTNVNHSARFASNDNLISTETFGNIFGGDRNNIYALDYCLSKSHLDTYIDTYLE